MGLGWHPGYLVGLALVYLVCLVCLDGSLVGLGWHPGYLVGLALVYLVGLVCLDGSLVGLGLHPGYLVGLAMVYLVGLVCLESSLVGRPLVNCITTPIEPHAGNGRASTKDHLLYECAEQSQHAAPATTAAKG